VRIDAGGGPDADRWVLVPIKAFGAAKQRQGRVLDGSDRELLVREMAAHVLAAANPLPVCVACDDHDVADFAEEHSALVCWTPGLGLNGAVEAGVAALAERGAVYVTVVHGDLPTASGIGDLEHFDGVTIAPDRRRTGTNLLRVPTASGFIMQFGHDSLREHVAECERRSLETWILDRDDLAFDVDEPEDLARLGERNRGTP
jgi:2-phospho-L-lactate guanylyltransferase